MTVKVTGNVVLRDPSTGQIVTLTKGDDLPEWAEVTNADLLAQEPTEAPDEPEHREPEHEPTEAQQSKPRRRRTKE